MGILGNRTQAEENVRSIKRVPSKYLDRETRDALIRRARQGENVQAYHSGQRTNWNLLIDGERIWLNGPDGGDAA